MRSLLVVLMIAFGLTFAVGFNAEAKGPHVASDSSDAYVPQTMGKSNVKAGSVPSNWVESYGTQSLRSDNDYRGGYVASSAADTFVVQKPRNSANCSSGI